MLSEVLCRLKSIRHSDRLVQVGNEIFHIVIYLRLPLGMRTARFSGQSLEFIDLSFSVDHSRRHHNHSFVESDIKRIIASEPQLRRDCEETAICILPAISA